MIVTLKFQDGRERSMTPEQLVDALTDYLAATFNYDMLRRAGPFIASIQMYFKFLDTQKLEHVRCPMCQFGRIGDIGDGYCSCPMGRDLKRIEAPTFNPVGGMDDDGAGRGEPT